MIVSQKHGIENLVKGVVLEFKSDRIILKLHGIYCISHCAEINHTFHANDIGRGSSRLMSWNEVVDPRNGFIKDDTVVFQVVYCFHSVMQRLISL